MAIDLVPPKIKCATIAKLWSSIGWRSDMLNGLLPIDVRLKLATIRVDEQELALDRFYWGLMSSSFA